MLTPNQCQEFLQNPTINPATGRSISPTGAIYKKYVRQCGQPQVNIASPTIVSPKVSSRPNSPPPVAPSKAKGTRAKTPGTKKSRGRPKGPQESPSTNLEPIIPSSPININLPTFQRPVTIAPPPPQPQIPTQLPKLNFPKQPSNLPPSNLPPIIPEFSNISFVQQPTTNVPPVQSPKTSIASPKLPPIVPIIPKQPSTTPPQITPKQPPKLPPLPPGLARTLPPVSATTVPKTPTPKTPTQAPTVQISNAPQTNVVVPKQPTQVPTISNLKGTPKTSVTQPTIPKIPPPATNRAAPKLNLPTLPKIPLLSSFPKGQINPVIAPSIQRVEEEQQIEEPELSRSQESQISIEEVPLGTLTWQGNSIMIGDPRDLFAFFRELQDIEDLNALLNDTENQNFDYWTGGEPGLGSIIISNLQTNGSFNILAERDEGSNNIAIHLE